MNRFVTLSLAIGMPLALGACEVAPKTSTQNGFRGTGMNTVQVKDSAAADEVPAPPYDPPGLDGPRAGAAYENVQVLGGVSEEQFTYTMAAITEWVSPSEGCNYCHNPANLADDNIYTKVVSRRMIEMTRAINQNWSNHVGETGVTCYTCHRGENVPEAHWTLPEEWAGTGIAGRKNGQNDPVSNAAWSSLPNAAVARYLMGDTDAASARVVSAGLYPHKGQGLSTMEAENNYAVMMHISQALGVNCTYCHNAASFQSWSTSNPPRETAYYGLDMVRAINNEYITPLANVFPANRKGPLGDPFKVNCTTCHKGQNKPLGGAKMVSDYPALRPTAVSERVMEADAAEPAEAAAEDES